MQVIRARNVHQALVEGCYQMLAKGVHRESRNGPVMMMPEPLTTVYERPHERVVFWRERDANPFFHLFESLWMLAGRNDVAFPAAFAKNIANYSDDGETLHGAYGYRWRAHFGFDQLQQVAQSLIKNPDCRRQVVAMWDPRSDLSRDGKDVPCNTQAYFQVNHLGQLDMMVTNRSNDLIWGAYGANAVHFSVLLAFMSKYTGYPMGTYYQTSMNTHFYLKEHKDLVGRLALHASEPPYTETFCPYRSEEVRAEPVLSINVNRWKRELSTFLAYGPGSTYDDPFFETVAKPMYRAWNFYKQKDWNSACGAIYDIEASDWRVACGEWVGRRQARVLQ